MTDSHSEPSVETVLEEVQRRRERRKQEAEEQSTTLSPTERRMIISADRLIFWISKHWLTIANLGAFLYIGLPFLSPILMHLGLETPGRVLHALYRPLCHQLPFRSWYLFGAQPTYSMEELARLVGPEALVEHGYIGDPTLGYKVALCQRDVAIYGTIFLAGLLYALTGRKLRPLPFWAYVLLGLVPIGLDGGIQLLTYALPLLIPGLELPPLESTPLRRTITGALFGLATVWMAYPHAQDAFTEIRETLEKRFGWE